MLANKQAIALRNLVTVVTLLVLIARYIFARSTLFIDFERVPLIVATTTARILPYGVFELQVYSTFTRYLLVDEMFQQWSDNAVDVADSAVCNGDCRCHGCVISLYRSRASSSSSSSSPD